MLSTIDLRLAHCPSRTPILIELKVQRDATVRQLRSQISEVMQTDEYCQMRVFGRLFVEMPCGGVKRLFVIEGEGESLLRLGIEDGDVIYLEGPLTGSTEGVGMAIAVLNEKMKQQSAEHALQTKQLREENVALRQLVQRQTDEIRTLAQQNQRTEANLKTQVTNLLEQLTRQSTQTAADLQALRNEISKQQQQAMQQLSDEIYALKQQNQRTEANLKPQVAKIFADQQALALQETSPAIHEGKP